MTFEEFNLNPQILEGLKDAAYITPTPIQEQTIPVILEGKDVIASAQTGTGKTAAFVVPILEILSKNPKRGVRALILTPTRELASQIDELIWGIGYHAGISSVNIIGGSDWNGQNAALKDGANIVVATPGRLMDQIQDLNLDLSNIEFFVLDEADRMMDMGFLPQVTRIIQKLPPVRQNLLFSATMPSKVMSIVEKAMKDPVRVNVASFKTADSVTQKVYYVSELQKVHLINFLFKSEGWKSTIIFTGTKRGTDRLAASLVKRGFNVGIIHGDRTQEEREQALNQFKNGEINVLVATDVIARGIDIDDVSHIINFDVPRDTDDYIHRIGRTGRADAKGEAITLVSPDEARNMEAIKKAVKIEITEMALPEEYIQQQQAYINEKRASKPQHHRRPHHERTERPIAEKENPSIEVTAEVSPQTERTEGERRPPRHHQNNRRPNHQNNNRQGNRNPNHQQKPNDDRKPRHPQGEKNQQKGQRTPQGNNAIRGGDTRRWEPEKPKGIVGFFKKLFGGK